MAKTTKNNPVKTEKNSETVKEQCSENHEKTVEKVKKPLPPHLRVDRVRSCPEYPNLLRKIHHQPNPDPVLISQICYGKSTISKILIVSDPVQISLICYGKFTLGQPYSVTNMGNPGHV